MAYLSPNSTWLITYRLDTTRHVRRVEPMHFGCVELVEQHGSTRSTRSSRLARHVERVESSPIQTWWAKWNLDFTVRSQSTLWNQTKNVRDNHRCFRTRSIAAVSLRQRRPNWDTYTTVDWLIVTDCEQHKLATVLQFCANSVRSFAERPCHNLQTCGMPFQSTRSTLRSAAKFRRSLNRINRSLL